MKKKFLSFALIFCLIVPCMAMLSACGHEHTFETAWSFNDTHHWHASTCEHSDEKKDYSEHVDADEDSICDTCNYGAQALVGETAYTSLEAAITAADDGATVVVFDDVDLATAIQIDKKITIDLNGKTLTVTEDTAGDGVFHVVTNGDLTINGEGVVDGVGNNKWNIVIFADGGNVTINGGTYTNIGAVDTGSENGGDTHFDVIYAKNGGTFKGQTPAWLLNIYDGSRTTSSIEVKGGTFHGFNPANNLAEGENTNFVADGYTVQENNGVYTVVAE